MMCKLLNVRKVVRDARGGTEAVVSEAADEERKLLSVVLRAVTHVR